jgi:acyl-CoA synthetase (AMP-forming)/AMP-acid ligase II
MRGEPVVVGDHVMAGYWRSPELSARRFRTWGPDHKRALFTGDVCSMDSDGYLYFHGRGDDIYKSRGFRVSTLEIELAARDISGVLDAAALPANAEGDAVLFVVSQIPKQDLMSGLHERLEDFKVPHSVEILDSIPTNTNGKPDKGALRQLCGHGVGGT